MTVAQAWHASNTVHHSDFTPERVAAERECSISICLPARDEAETIGAIVAELALLRSAGVIDELVVVDDSTDGTAAIAREAGADVHDQSALMGDFGPVQGKGDAMWRALSVLTGDVICFLDADSGEFGRHFACGLVGPLACGRGTNYAKAYYRRPFRLGEVRLPEGGGRVTELMARPLLNRFYPDLAGFVQPLAGEVAARRSLLLKLPFAIGYGVDIGLLIDSWRSCGLGAMAQVDLDVRQNRHRPLSELGPMAYAVLAAVTSRLERDARLEPSPEAAFLAPSDGGLSPVSIEMVERPPMASLRALAEPA